MKKNLLLIMAASVTAIMMLGSTKAQIAMNQSSDINSGFSYENNADNNKSILAADVNSHVLKDFKKRFSASISARWYETDKVFTVRFSADSIETMVGYGKHGNWLYTIKRYNEKLLPTDVRAIVRSTYYDYTFSHIDEVNVPQQENTIYILLLRNNKDFKLVRVCNYEMEVIKDYHE
jgi:hypothetical protein